MAEEPPQRKRSTTIQWPSRQVRRKFEKHAADFGVAQNYTPQAMERFKQALMHFVDRPGMLEIQATFRRQPVTAYTDQGYSMVVLVSPLGEFVSGWKLNEDQSRNLRWRKSL